MVQNKRVGETGGWTVMFQGKGFLQKPTNFNFFSSENIKFNESTRKILFNGKAISINDFIDSLEKNHLRDMFFFSRIRNFFTLLRLQYLFFLSDSRFDRYKHVIEARKNVNQPFSDLVKTDDVPVTENKDPLFHYFRIYKNLLGVMILLLLPYVWAMSYVLKESYFTVTNPFFLFLSILILFVLENASSGLYFLLKKTDFVYKRGVASMESRGRIK